MKESNEISTPAAIQKPKPWKKRHSDINKIADAMESSVATSGRSGFSTGDLAELRRIDAKRPYSPTLWRTLLAYEIDKGWPEEGPFREQKEERWAAILMGMAFTIGQHDPKTPLGKALANSGWSETRFVRLMDARNTHLIEEIRRLAQYLSSKSQPLKWQDIADLVLLQEGDPAERIRRRIARAYYRHLNTQE